MDNIETFNFRVFLRDSEIANIDIDARNKQEAIIMINRRYPPTKGFKWQISND